MSKTLEENTWSKILFFDAWTYFTKVKKIHAFYFVCIFLVTGRRRLRNRTRKDSFINRSLTNVSIANVWLYYEKNEHNETQFVLNCSKIWFYWGSTYRYLLNQPVFYHIIVFWASIQLINYWVLNCKATYIKPLIIFEVSLFVHLIIKNS